MSKLKEVEPIVLRILIEKPYTRKSDEKLIVEVYADYNPDVLRASFPAVMLSMKALGLPSYKSIERARRRLQERYPSLVDEATALLRSEQEELYIAYSRS